MRVKCVICDNIELIGDYDPLAKKLRNRPIHTFMCTSCHERIAKRTEERIATGKFKLYKPNDVDNDW